jgi:hypothetical protein
MLSVRTLKPKVTGSIPVRSTHRASPAALCGHDDLCGLAFGSAAWAADPFNKRAVVDDDLVQGALENGELLIIELRDEQFRDAAQPRRWTGAVSVRRVTPASVSATTMPELQRT